MPSLVTSATEAGNDFTTTVAGSPLCASGCVEGTSLSTILLYICISTIVGIACGIFFTLLCQRICCNFQKGYDINKLYQKRDDAASSMKISAPLDRYFQKRERILQSRSGSRNASSVDMDKQEPRPLIFTDFNTNKSSPISINFSITDSNHVESDTDSGKLEMAPLTRDEFKHVNYTPQSGPYNVTS